MSIENGKDSPWKSNWRPAMGWLYLSVCICDFILFPIGFTIVQFWEEQAVNDAFRQWNPITLSGAGFFHIAMGAVLGITSYGRTQEKIEDKRVIANQMEQSLTAKQKIKIDEQIG
jgi:hypothetical protein